MNDDGLVSGLQSGDEKSFRLIVEQHQRKVINICYRFVHNRAEAEDLAQETFIEVYRSIKHFRGQSSLSTWIHRIAVSKSLDFVRKQSRQKRGGKLRAFLGLNNSTSEIPAPELTRPDKVHEQQQQRDILRRALNTLPKNQQIAFVLSKYNGMSYQKIADTLKTSVSAVESLIFRAKKNLQKNLKSYYEGIERNT